MSVVGFDIGNFKSSIGIAKQGGIDIVDNEYSDRITPTYVSFQDRVRLQGHSAKQLEVTHSQNTFAGFKRLLGRRFHDPLVQHELQLQPLRISASPQDDKILFNADYMGELKHFTAEQITGMFLTKLKQIAESHMPTKMYDCVVSVPSFMTDTERRALLDAAQIAGLNVLKLMNETTAVALNYGLYNTNLPDVNEKSSIVAFVDMGYTQTQVSLVSFNKGKLKVLATAYDNNLGGRDFDRLLMDHFQQEFKDKYKIDAYSNVRARLRLRAECEKVKKVMSSVTSPVPFNIECLMNDKDVSSSLKRDDFEALSLNLLQRFRNVLTDVLTEAHCVPTDIDVVEIVGGSTRIPVIKRIIQEVLGKEPSTTLNADEACARGCTLMCAILSPTFKVKEFKIEDTQIFPITLNWKGAETDDNELEVFAKWDKTPAAKMLTIYKKEPFEIEARYRFPNDIPFGDVRIGKFQVANVVPNANGDNSEVKIKARITKNGIFEISNPQLVEILPQADGSVDPLASTTAAVQDVSMDTDKNDSSANAAATAEENSQPGETPDNSESTESVAPTASEDSQQATPAAAPAAAVKKRKTKLTDLPLNIKVPQLTKADLNLYFENEVAMQQQDRKEKEISEAKNAVEEYIYDMRDKISNDYEAYVRTEVRSQFSTLLQETEDWLYSDEAENQEKSVYVDRLLRMKEIGDPIRQRYREHADRPVYFEELGKALQLISKALGQYQQGDEKYVHLEKSEVDKAAKLLDEKRKWFDEKSSQLMSLKPFDDPPVLCSNIKSEKEALEKTCWAIFNRAKPKVDKPKDAPPTPTPPEQQQSTNGQDGQPKQAAPGADMDVD